MAAGPAAFAAFAAATASAAAVTLGMAAFALGIALLLATDALATTKRFALLERAKEAAPKADGVLSAIFLQLRALVSRGRPAGRRARGGESNGESQRENEDGLHSEVLLVCWPVSVDDRCGEVVTLA